MKQTAVDWLEDNLIGNPFSEKDFAHNVNIFKKAKEIEKEQIEESWIEGGGYSHLSEESDRMLAQLYYNETYGKK